MRRTLLVTMLVLPACRPAVPETVAQPPGPESAPLPAARPDPDALFMQRMIPHHAQALEMTKLVPGRSSRRDVNALAERIRVSQAEEIAAMQRWLRARGHAVPPADAHAHAAAGHGELMPGMLTAAELELLARASGPGFDRLFLSLMIRHHEGALTMVQQLFATPGAGQDSEAYRFATDVDADQRAEIRRMKAMLE